jgi:glycosyltransferase involved in cell wall biosynthesis
MTPPKPRVSVCLATFNGERYVGRQLESILAQLGPHDEVVVSDDGSTDRTLDIIRGLGDGRIQVHAAQRHGITPNFENALARAAGDFILLSDQDDVWLPGKVAASCDALQTRRLVVCDCRVVDEEGRTLHESYFALMNSGPGALRNFVRNRYLGCCMAFRRELLELALPIPSGVAHDFWIGMLEELTGKPLFLPRVLLEYRRHRAAASYAAGKSQRPIAVRLATRATLALALLARLTRKAKAHAG